MRTVLVTLIIGAIALSAVPSPAAAADFVIVVNDANPATSMDKARISRLFLKRQTTWDDSSEVVPVDLPGKSPVRESFSTAIHGRDVPAIRSYWQSMIFAGRAKPPAEKATDAEVLAFVRGNAGAIGYVAADADLGDGVKVLEVSGS